MSHEFYKNIDKSNIKVEDNDDILRKIRRCCEYLKVKEPIFKRRENLEKYLSSIEEGVLRRLIIEDHRDI